MVLVVVIVTRTRDRQRQRLLALTRREETDGVDLATVRIRGIGSALDVVGLRVVVDERHAIADRDDQLLRVGAGGGDPNDRRIRWGRCRARAGCRWRALRRAIAA